MFVWNYQENIQNIDVVTCKNIRQQIVEKLKMVSYKKFVGNKAI